MWLDGWVSCLAPFRLLLVALLIAGGLVVSDQQPASAAPGDIAVTAVIGGEAEGEIVVSLDCAVGASEAALTIVAGDDGLFEGPEVSDIGVAVDRVVHRFSIVVVDAATPKLSIRTRPSVVVEGESARVAIESDIAPVNPVALTVRTRPDGAEHGEDLVELNDLVVLAAGSTTAETSVLTLDDDVAERFGESVEVEVHLGAPADVPPDARTASSAPLRILDDEPYFGFVRPRGSTRDTPL